MDSENSCDSKDVKPLVNLTPTDFTTNNNPTTNSNTKKWSPGSWQDANRKSAFQPYKQQPAQATTCTVLTNLQRGNTQADTPIPQPKDISFHTRAGQGEITELDIKQQKSVNVCDSNGLTALHWASAYGQTNSVQLLLNHGADFEKIGPDGETALLLAASGGHIDVLRLLISKGADINKQDDVGNTALMYAASSNHPHCCNELLLSGAELMIKNLCDDTAYDLALDNKSNLAKIVIENHLLSLLQS